MEPEIQQTERHRGGEMEERGCSSPSVLLNDRPASLCACLRFLSRAEHDLSAPLYAVKPISLFPSELLQRLQYKQEHGQ